MKLTRNFDSTEFICQCGHCNDDGRMDPAFMALLQELRDKIGRIDIASGHRCVNHNADVGGAKNSQHIHRRAADLIPREVPMWVAVAAAYMVGFDGLGFGKRKLHVDRREAGHAWWTYRSKEHVG